MSINLKSKLVGGILAALGGTTAAGVTVYDRWDEFGWTTPSQHDQDMLEAVGEVKDFRDEWKCDEYDEELLELKRDQAAGDDSVDTQHTIEQIKEKMRELECSRFDDFG